MGGIAEDSPPLICRRLPEFARDGATAELAEAACRVDVAHRRYDPLAVANSQT